MWKIGNRQAKRSYSDQARLEGQAMDLSTTSLIDSTRFEKIVLAKKVGRFLTADQVDVERRTVENVARVLAKDISTEVRSVLAFELRKCKRLSKDLANKIATDIEQVSGPFLHATKLFSNDALEGMIPDLQDSVRAWLARRSDLSESVIHTLAQVGEEKSIAALLRNDVLQLPVETCQLVLKRFGQNRALMDHLSAREDLPLMIAEQVIEKVSSHFKQVLVHHYCLDGGLAKDLAEGSGYEVMWSQIEASTPSQIHAFVTDLRVNNRLTHQTVLEMAQRGSVAFMESAFALQAGLPIERVRTIMTLAEPPAFVRMLKSAKVPDAMAPKFLRLAKAQNEAKCES